jgi:formamidopyrimidine-DNA glycosylase
MPEMPEVETIVRALRNPLVGRTILGAAFPGDPRRMTNMDGATISARIAGQSIRQIYRRAKYLLFRLEPDTLVVHLKMTGHLYIAPSR